MAGNQDHWAARIAPGLFVVLWSSGFIGAKFGLPYAEPFTFLSIRMAVAIAFFAAVALVTRAPRPPAREIGHNVVTGLLVHGAYLGGVFVAIGHALPAGLAAMGWLLFDERLDALSLLGMAVCAGAVFLVNVRATR